jgi:hypothetical protein
LKVLNLSGNPLGLRRDNRCGDRQGVVSWRGRQLRPCTTGVRWMSRWISPDLMCTHPHLGGKVGTALGLVELHLADCAIGAHAASGAGGAMDGAAARDLCSSGWEVAIHELALAIVCCGGGGSSGSESRGSDGVGSTGRTRRKGFLVGLDLRRNPLTSAQYTLLVRAVAGCPSMSDHDGTFNGLSARAHQEQEVVPKSSSPSNISADDSNTSAANTARKYRLQQRRQPQRQERQPQHRHTRTARRSPPGHSLSPSLYSNLSPSLYSTAMSRTPPVRPSPSPAAHTH